MTRRPPTGTIIAAARAMRARGADAAEIRAHVVALHGSAAADRIVSRLRAAGELPPRAAKLELMHLKPGPKARERLRKLAAERGVSHHRAAHQAFLAGLAVLERRA